jgi:hypothetical protein
VLHVLVSPNPAGLSKNAVRKPSQKKLKGAKAMIDLERLSLGATRSRREWPSRRDIWNAAFLVLTALAALLVLPVNLNAQELEGTLTGTVTDASGAVISGAAVTITLNGVGGETRAVRTDADGNFTATNLPAGTYTVSITSPGFASFTDKNVVLNVAQKRAISAQLKTGSETQTVVVQENPVAIDTDSSAQAGTIDGTQVRELELINRNFEQLVTLQPGVVNTMGDEPGFGLNSNSAISVNGARETANNWSVDGADINDSGSNATLLNIPSIDAIQEFTLERSSYDASFGRSGGGQIVVATRSGTSDFHGSAYEFVRTEQTDANLYFNNLSDTPRSADHYNNFGFTIGGPIFIPHVYNSDRKKTFFFWSEEWRKTVQPTTNDVAAATPAELAGKFDTNPTDYAATVAAVGAKCVSAYTPLTTGTNPTGYAVASPSCFSANSQVYLSQVVSKFPANYTAVSNGFTYGDNITGYSTLNNFRQDLVRVDHYFNDKVHFFARGMQDDVPESLPTGLWGGNNYPGVVNVAINAPGKNVVGNLTWTISPKMVNEVEFAYSQGTISGALSGQANSASILSSLTNKLAYQDPYGRIPSATVLDGSVTVVSQGSAPYFERNLDRNLFDNFTLTLGRHTIRSGFTAQQMLKTEDASEGNPSFQFNTWGDFLLGNAALYTQASRDIIPDLHFVNLEAFVQDDWKVSHRLNINLGVRWSRFPSPSDVRNTLNNFDPLLYKPNEAPVLEGSSASNPGSFAPGQAYTPATYANGLIFPQGTACQEAQAISGQVTCSPYGSVVNPNNNLNFGPRVGFAWTPYASGKTVLRGGFGTFYDRTLDGIWEQNAFGDPPLVQTATIANTKFDNPVGAGSNATPLGPNALTTTGDPTFKVPSYADYNLSLQQQLASSTTLEIAYVGSTTRHLLGEVDMNMPTLSTRADNATAPLNNIRPYLGYSDFHTRTPVFTGNYNSLQVSLNHRMRDLQLQVAYTWSRNLSDQYNDRGVANTYTYDPMLDYGATGLNQPDIFIANFVYKEPFFRGQQGWLGHTLGGWELSGITTFESGISFSNYQTVDPFDCVTPTNATSGCVAGTYPGGLGMNGPNYDILPRPDQTVPTVKLLKHDLNWFDPSDFTKAVAHFGSETAGSLLGPGFEKVDLGLMKNFRFTERVNLQMRAESFNVLNHTNFNSIDSGLEDGTFGEANGAHEGRKMQFSGKLYF